MTTSAPESVIDLISEILVETFEIPAEEVRADARMRDLLTDSLMVVEMAIAVHEALGFKVDEEELRDTTLAELAAVLDVRRTER
ncbi:acyl carrier protein [Streptomyces sp. 4.24]|uniref:acyl carrier protein n=1 Tax=Streptomyces tritrimontium TaxID=3406573 RepID=UPI003BB6B524